MDALSGGGVQSPLIDKTTAVELLGAMLGGYNIAPLLDALGDSSLAPIAAKALSGLTLVYDAFDEVLALSEKNPFARQIIENWAEAGWFNARPQMPESIRVKIFRVEGEINTDDFSPASDAWSRPRYTSACLEYGDQSVPGRPPDDRGLARSRASGGVCR